MPTFSDNSANTTDPQCPCCVTYTRIVLKIHQAGQTNRFSKQRVGRISTDR